MLTVTIVAHAKQLEVSNAQTVTIVAHAKQLEVSNAQTVDFISVNISQCSGKVVSEKFSIA